MAMASRSQDTYLGFNAFDVFGSHFGFVDYFDSNFLACGDVHREMHFAECALSEILSWVRREVPRR